MSRSGYSYEDDDPAGGLWRGAVRRAIRGKRGQAALRELLKAMDTMPKKALAAKSLVTEDGEFCTLGVLGVARGLNLGQIDPYDWDAVAAAFNIAPAMAREIFYENDECAKYCEWVQFELCGPVRPGYPDFGRHTRYVRVDFPAESLGYRRWLHMHQWVESNLKKGLFE